MSARLSATFHAASESRRLDAGEILWTAALGWACAEFFNQGRHSPRSLVEIRPRWIRQPLADQARYRVLSAIALRHQTRAHDVWRAVRGLASGPLRAFRLGLHQRGTRPKPARHDNGRFPRGTGPACTRGRISAPDRTAGVSPALPRLLVEECTRRHMAQRRAHAVLRDCAVRSLRVRTSPIAIRTAAAANCSSPFVATSSARVPGVATPIRSSLPAGSVFLKAASPPQPGPTADGAPSPAPARPADPPGAAGAWVFVPAGFAVTLTPRTAPADPAGVDPVTAPPTPGVPGVRG
ncbi:hypothetical protein FB474_1515 [Oryzihumus leptocrescens]|uniref:Uncharacterized protein n=1 Tax=Oryzihumus leptocrescens TaxID=297536 RepID=A0A542ZIG7_9MICO|nr:hypothetical protein FB474_1515 [Oryzihumus leptocrescens]